MVIQVPTDAMSQLGKPVIRRPEYKKVMMDEGTDDERQITISSKMKPENLWIDGDTKTRETYLKNVSNGVEFGHRSTCGHKAEIGDNCKIKGTVEGKVGADVTVPERVTVHQGAFVHSGTEIGEYGVKQTIIFGEVSGKIGRESRIGKGAQVHGKEIGRAVEIKKDATVEAGAEIGDYSIVGEGSTVGEKAKIQKEVALGNGVTVGGHAIINERVSIGGGSTLGEKVTIASGTELHENVTVGKQAEIFEKVFLNRDATVGEKAKIRRGVSIAHDVSIGDGAEIGEGTKLGERFQVAAGTKVDEYLKLGFVKGGEMSVPVTEGKMGGLKVQVIDNFVIVHSNDGKSSCAYAMDDLLSYEHKAPEKGENQQYLDATYKRGGPVRQVMRDKVSKNIEFLKDVAVAHIEKAAPKREAAGWEVIDVSNDLINKPEK